MRGQKSSNLIVDVVDEDLPRIGELIPEVTLGQADIDIRRHQVLAGQLCLLECYSWSGKAGYDTCICWYRW